MKYAKVLCLWLLGLATTGFAQTKIEAQDGIHYITTNIDYPITGTYLFKGAEPVVELNATGTGFYQRHEQPKKAITWGIECDESGNPILKKDSTMRLILCGTCTPIRKLKTRNTGKSPALPFILPV